MNINSDIYNFVSLFPLGLAILWMIFEKIIQFVRKPTSIFGIIFSILISLLSLYLAYSFFEFFIFIFTIPPFYISLVLLGMEILSLLFSKGINFLFFVDILNKYNYTTSDKRAREYFAKQVPLVRTNLIAAELNRRVAFLVLFLIVMIYFANTVFFSIDE